jgi:hypothetical protein
VRCLGHIINLAAKAFLFSKDPDSFEANSRNKKESRILKLPESSRAHGSYRKFHNTIQFIRITPQRRDKWSEIADGTVEEDLESKLPIDFSTKRRGLGVWPLSVLIHLMVIADNETRWNSAYLSMQSGLKLRGKFMQLSGDHRDELGDDMTTTNDSNVLEWATASLEPFWTITQHLQGKARFGHHGATWEALPTREHLLNHLEKLKRTTHAKDDQLLERINNSWSKLTEYHNLIVIKSTPQQSYLTLRREYIIPTRTEQDNRLVGYP